MAIWGCLRLLRRDVPQRYCVALASSLLGTHANCPLSLAALPVLTNRVRTHMGGDHSHQHSLSSPNTDPSTAASADRVTQLGLCADIALTFGKGAAGAVSGSTAILADAAHSLSDVVLSGIALWSLKVARAPSDKEHPYGHGKFETLGALGISGMLLLTGGGIAWHAVEVLQALLPALSSLDSGSMLETAKHAHAHHSHVGHHHALDMDHKSIALTAAVVSIGVKEGLYWLTKHVGETTGSQLLQANAWHHRSDAVSSLVALVGVGGSILGVPFLDPLAGLLVSGMIVKAGLQCGYQSLQELVDKGLPEAVLAPVRDTIMGVDGVLSCHGLRGRRMGSSLHLNVHIQVDPWLSVSAAHAIGEAVRHQLRKTYQNLTETYVHIEPGFEFVSDNSLFQKHQTVDECPSKASLSQIPLGPHVKTTHVCEDMLDDVPVGTVVLRQQPDVEKDVRTVLSSRFYKVFKIEQVTCHFRRTQVLVDVEVSMDPGHQVREAMKYAQQAGQVLLENLEDVCVVTIKVRLSRCTRSHHLGA